MFGQYKVHMFVLLPTRNIQISARLITLQSGRPTHSTGGIRKKNKTTVSPSVVSKSSSVTSVTFQLWRRHHGLPHHGFSWHHTLVVLSWRVWGSSVRCLSKQYSLQCLMLVVSGGSVVRDTSLITLSLLPTFGRRGSPPLFFVSVGDPWGFQSTSRPTVCFVSPNRHSLTDTPT
jgi:hypothetical protein